MSVVNCEEIKNAIAARLLQGFPGTSVYKEAVTTPNYPHFFIHLISGSDNEERKNHHILNHSFDLRYRVASDPSTDLKLEQKLDAVARKLFAGLNIIDCNDVKIRIENKHYEKTDGVLHFFCEVNMKALLEEEPQEKFKDLEVDIGVKE